MVRFGSDVGPQPCHLDPEAARTTFFGGLAASGWHWSALTMRSVVDGEMAPVNGVIGTGVDKLT